MHPGAYAAQMQIAMEGIDDSVRKLCAKFDLQDAIVDLNAISHRDARIVQLRRLQAANEVLQAVVAKTVDKPKRGRPKKETKPVEEQPTGNVEEQPTGNVEEQPTEDVETG